MQLPRVQLPRSVSEFTWQNSKKKQAAAMRVAAKECEWVHMAELWEKHAAATRAAAKDVSEFTWQKSAKVSVHQAKLLLNDKRKTVQPMSVLMRKE